LDALDEKGSAQFFKKKGKQNEYNQSHAHIHIQFFF